MIGKSAIALAAAAGIAIAIPAALSHPNNGHRHHHGAKHLSLHGHKHGHSERGIALAVDAVVLLAIAAAAKAHEHRPDYQRHHGRTDNENAVAACLHKAQRRTVRKGGYGVTLRKLNYVHAAGAGWRVSIGVKQRLPGGSRYRNAVCTVHGDRVGKLAWS